MSDPGYMDEGQAEQSAEEMAEAESAAEDAESALSESAEPTAPEADPVQPKTSVTPVSAEPATPAAENPDPQVPAEAINPSRDSVDPAPSEPASASASASGEPATPEPTPGIEFVDDLSVLIIFDNSGSMQASWGGSDTRWSIANRALYDALAPVATSLKVAAVRFPIGDACEVGEFSDEVHFGWQLAGEFLAEWEADALPPNGSTPLGAAFLAADEAIAQASEQGLLEERFNVIVFTDGEPNCESDPALLTQLPAKWLEAGVHTHVLGLPGSSTAATLLNEIAAAGGTGESVALAETAPEMLTGEVTSLAR
jgi:hypothetical protein